MTEYKTKHPGKLALDFLRGSKLHASLDAATDSGEINDVLVSAKHLVALMKTGENETYWKKELQTAPQDLPLLATLLTAIDEDRLDAAGSKALRALTKTIIGVTLPSMGNQFNGLSLPEIPPNSIYSGKNPATSNLLDGEPAEFGIYPEEQSYNSVVSAFFIKNRKYITDQKRTNNPDPVLEVPITKKDLVGLEFDAVSGDYQMFSAKPIKCIMDSPNAFSEISRKEFVSAYLKAAEQPQTVGFFAMTALTSVYAKNIMETNNFEHQDEEMKKRGLFIDRIYNLKSDSFRGNFMFSAKEFTVNEFAQKPLTVEEIKAIPFLTGLYNEIYAEVEHNHGVHAQACADKMRSAGHDILAEAIELNIPARASKPVRKHGDDLSPGM
jgi:hypothetical protein